MSWQEEAVQIIGTGLAAIGGLGVVIVGVSALVSKLIVGSMLAKQTHELSSKLEAIKKTHASELEVAKAELASKLEATKRELDIIKEKTLRFQNDKIVTYRIVIDMVARFLGALDAHYRQSLPQPEAWARFDQFNEERIKVYGYLAMLAPQAVMDAQDRLVDNLLLVANGNAVYEWRVVREHALMMLNAVRDDIGIADSPISYNGNL